MTVIFDRTLRNFELEVSSTQSLQPVEAPSIPLLWRESEARIVSDKAVESAKIGYASLETSVESAEREDAVSEASVVEDKVMRNRLVGKPMKSGLDLFTNIKMRVAHIKFDISKVIIAK